MSKGTRSQSILKKKTSSEQERITKLPDKGKVQEQEGYGGGHLLTI